MADSVKKPPRVTGFKTTEMGVKTDLHVKRHRDILAKYPEVEALYGADCRLLPCIVAISAVQFALAFYAANNIENWGLFFVVAWSVGGTLTHWLSLGNHELCHNLAFESELCNEMLGIFSNLAQGIPSFIAFKKYHFYHHYYLNEEKMDPDVPSAWEAGFFNTPVKKAIWMLLNPAFYGLRPLILFPMPASWKEIFNLVFVLAFDAGLALTCGYKVVLFNMASTVLGMGIHPIAGHFISEHYDLYNDDNGQETYSYYGPLNYVSFNVGYHNEHHDFPKVSGFRLPAIRDMAPEFYKDLHPHHSWSKIVYDYVFNDDIGPFCRIIRRERKKSL